MHIYQSIWTGITPLLVLLTLFTIGFGSLVRLPTQTQQDCCLMKWYIFIHQKQPKFFKENGFLSPDGNEI